MKVLELCAGGGGQALGLDLAGYETSALVEIEKIACETLQHNRPKWNVIQADLKTLNPSTFKNIDCQVLSIQRHSDIREIQYRETNQDLLWKNSFHE